VFINQAGIAVANTKLLIPMLVIFILFLLQLFQQLTGSAIPYKYSDARKQAALDKLAITLLLHQDKAIVYNDGTYSLTHSRTHLLTHSLTHLL
jgi:biopolymer transport protein ExbD